MPAYALDSMASSAPLFAPFRALGYVCDDVPFAVQRLGTDTFVTVSVGNTWQVWTTRMSAEQPPCCWSNIMPPAQVYNCAKITLVLVGPPLPSRIVALAATKHHTIAALDDGTIHIADRTTPLPPLSPPPGPALDPPHLMLLGTLLIVCYPQRRTLITWDLASKLPTIASSVFLPPGFAPTALCHPDTYVHKVVVGSDDGRLAVVNVARGTVLYVSEPLGAAVTALASSPALDVLGVGLADGCVGGWLWGE